MTQMTIQQDNGIVPAETQQPNLLLMLQSITDRDDAPIEALEKMMGLYERQQANQARMEYNAAMVAAQADMPVVVRDGHNTHTNSRYAKMENVQKTIKSVYNAHGFTVTISEDETKSNREGWVRVVAIVRHIGGHDERFYREGPIDDKGPKGNPTKSELHGVQSTVSYLGRTLTCAIFDVTIADHDNDGNGSNGKPAEFISDERIKAIRKMIDDSDSDVVKMLEAFGVDTLEEMTDPMWSEAMRLMKTKIDKRAKAAQSEDAA